MYNLDIKALQRNKVTDILNFLALSQVDLKSTFYDHGILIAIDIKDFKGINEEYGFELGDLVLKELGKVLLETIHRVCKKACYLYHIGGDEFLIVMPKGDETEGKGLMDFVLKRLKEVSTIICPIAIHTKIFAYEEAFKSIASLMEVQYKNADQHGKFSTEFMLEYMMRIYDNSIKELFDKLEDSIQLALYDDISGLKNHRAAEQHLENIKMHRSEDTETAVLFIDGDNLKKWNSISYERGNQMIRDLAALISDSLREDDKVFRWLSGDEFLCVLNTKTREDALHLSERVRAHVEASTINWTYPVTISIGLSFMNRDSNWHTSVDQASQANSLAKKSGKNKVVLYEEVDKAI